MMDFLVHFDIWNKIEEKNFFQIFFIFPKFIGGTLTILVIIVRVPPMNFGKPTPWGLGKFGNDFYNRYFDTF